MDRRVFSIRQEQRGLRLLLILLVSGVLSGVLNAGEQKAIDVGSRKQLFFDKKFIDSSDGITITMNPPVKAGIVLRPEKPWEKFRLTSYFTVIQEKDHCRMYYSCFSEDQWSVPNAWEKHAYLCCATSKDGIHWERPNLGIVEFEGSKQNNIVLKSVVDGTVFVDPTAPPEQRYKLLHTIGPHIGGLRVSYSADGYHFTIGEPVSPWNPDSQQVAFWDKRIKNYAVYLRKNTDRGRSVGHLRLDDITKPWPAELPIVFTADANDPRDVDFYTNCCVLYPWAADAYFMFPAAYHHFPPQMGNDGLLDVSIACSRDGVKWQRPDRGPYIRLGENSQWDGKFIMAGVGLVRMGNEIYQYYNGIDMTHIGTRRMQKSQRDKTTGWGFMGRVVQRLDGFYSADAAYAGGRLVTPPIRFSGKQLVLNLDTSSAGHARVSILDAAGKPLPGYSITDCEIILDNNVAHVVTWDGKSDISALAGKPVRLRFEMRSAKLYAFQFE
ncbi:MAG: hypothetical protein JXM70_22745 [Pirellulales bacterium]|nr:hypothetical protein [Pirellulales bacterium]